MSQLPPPPPPPSPPQPPSPEPPQYNVYRSRRRLRDRLGPAARSPLDALRRGRRPKAPGEPTPKRGFTWRRGLKWVGIAVLAWVLISIVTFFVSAQTAPGVDSATKNALSGGGTMLTGSNVLVLGLDQRPKNWKEPGANQGPPRTDSMMIMHVGVGSVRKLSILRDTRVDIPGHGFNRINAAYAIGGGALTIKTVEKFLPGVKINHVMIVNFANFGKLIDSLGGIDVTLPTCVISNNTFDGKRFHLRKGEHHLDGTTALRYSRVRENKCAPKQFDNARAARQQQVLNAVKARLTSPLHWPHDFFYGPFIAWKAPRAFETDVHGPGLSALFIDLATGGTGKTTVLQPDRATPFNPDGTVNVTQSEADDAAKKLLGQ
jgi:LCP family protein required for cell wall assembly